jgi:hypothetical protein
MASDQIALLTDSFNAVPIATVAYVGFPRLETRFTLVVILLLVYAVLTLAPLCFSRTTFACGRSGCDSGAAIGA